MAAISDDRLNGGVGVVGERKHPSITPRWLRHALSAGRTAFEREMKRDRRTIDREFERYWKESGTRQA
jgi:hypothetical protein